MLGEIFKLVYLFCLSSQVEKAPETLPKHPLCILNELFPGLEVSSILQITLLSFHSLKVLDLIILLDFV